MYPRTVREAPYLGMGVMSKEDSDWLTKRRKKAMYDSSVDIASSSFASKLDSEAALWFEAAHEARRLEVHRFHI